MKKISLSLLAMVFAINFSYAQWTGGPTSPVYYNGGNVGIGTASPNGVFHIHNSVGYIDNAANQLVLTNSGYRSSESGTLPSDNAGMAFYFTNYNAGGNMFDRTLDIRVRGNGDGTYGAGMIRFFANDYTSGSIEREIMRIHGNGRVGIGTTSPLGLLSLTNQISNTSNSNNPVSYTATSGVIGQSIINSYYVGNSDGSGTYPRYLDIASVGSPDGTNGGGNIRFLTNPITANSPAVERMRVSSNGNILIGQTSQVNSAYKLDVAGPVRANEIVVNTTGADFVFESSYKLPSISSVEKYINKNHHLPEIASAKQMHDDGLSVGENQVKLLQKVEKLTLYIIELKKENEILKAYQKTINAKLKHHHIN